jgi:hypothetical protein
MPSRRQTACHTASCPVTASGMLTPFNAIQSIIASHWLQSHHGREYPKQQ